jgi:quercetin dioxygenase-like cupin family protein
MEPEDTIANLTQSGRCRRRCVHQGNSMKRFASMLTLVIGGFAAFGASAAEQYKDGCAIAPNNCKILKEEGRTRVIDYTAKAGDKVAMHSHPPHVIYVLQGGKTKFTTPDGKVTELDAKAGDVFINRATVHSSEHLTDLHVIIVEKTE